MLEEGNEKLEEAAGRGMVVGLEDDPDIDDLISNRCIMINGRKCKVLLSGRRVTSTRRPDFDGFANRRR